MAAVVESETLFRANSAFELVPLHGRGPNRQLESPSASAILRSLRADLPSRIVDTDTARLYTALGRPAPIPEEFRGAGPLRWRCDVVRLVCDEVLEIAIDGAFVSGLRALLPLSSLMAEEGDGTSLSRLSMAALRRASLLPRMATVDLAARLYGYNAFPLSPAWSRRLAGGDATLRFLGLDRGGANSSLTDPWMRTPAHVEADEWLSWTPREPASASPLRYKLYLSPRLDAAAETLARALAVLGAAGAPPFKIGVGAAGLLRPDKFVAYFADRGALEAAAGTLRRTLEGLAAHGVPFSGQVDRDGLLSWGLDPTPEGRPGFPRLRDSWRGWVSNRLAKYVRRFGALGTRAECIAQAARARLALDGVDVDGWTPDIAIWDPADEEAVA